MRRAYLTVATCQAFAAIATLFSLRWLAMYVDPATFGRYSLYQSIVAAASLFLVSWPNAALLRFGREEWNRDGRVGRTLGARALLFTASIVIAATAAWLLDPWLRTVLRVGSRPFAWILLGVIVTPAAELAIYLNQVVNRPEAYGYSPLIARAGFLLGVVLIPTLSVHPDWTYLAGWLVVSTAAAATASFVAVPRRSWSGARVDCQTVSTILRYSWTLPLAAVSTYVVNWIDTWVIRSVRGIGPVGIYSWAYQTTAIAGLAFAPLAAVLTPRAIDARVNGDTWRINRYTQSILPAVLLMAVVVTAGLVAIRPALDVVAKPSYRAAYPVILVLLSGLPFQLLGYLVTPLANAYERLLPRFVLVSIVVAAVNAVGDLLLVSRIGIAGAAISTACAFAIGGLLQLVVVRQVGAAFAPLWRYTLPGWILIPAVFALSFHTRVDLAVSVIAAGAGLLAALWAATATPFRWRRSVGDVLALPRALALSEPVSTRV